MHLSIAVPTPYDFAQSVKDYGWIELAPVSWIPERKTLRRVERLTSGTIMVVEISAPNPETLSIVTHGARLTKIEKQEVVDCVRHMLRLDEDFSDFYARCRRLKYFKKIALSGRGRLLRSPTFFEDIVKTICTTNTTWSQTKGMVARLVGALGEPFPSDPSLKTFPTPERIARADEKLFEKNIRLGYRSAYIQQLAREVVSGERDVEQFLKSQLPLGELKKELKKIKGVGDYAAHTLLMLLGRYDEVAVDSELRDHVRRFHAPIKELTDKEMAVLYEPWGPWKYLAYWFESAP